MTKSERGSGGDARGPGAEFRRGRVLRACVLVAVLLAPSCIVDADYEYRDYQPSSRRELLQRHIGQAQDELRQLQADKARLEREVASLEAEVKSLEVQRSELASRTESLQQELAESLEKQTFLERSLAESKKRIDEVSKQLRAAGGGR